MGHIVAILCIEGAKTFWGKRGASFYLTGNFTEKRVIQVYSTASTAKVQMSP